jgi:hypothetical protein
VNGAVQWQMMATMNTIPKRRWLQFNLRTLLIVVTLTALSLGWWQHRSHCLERAKVHDWEALACLIQGTIEVDSGWEDELPPQPVDKVRVAEQERLVILSKRHDETSAAFRLAVWLPWLRWSIHEPPIEVDSEQNQGQ